MLPELHIIHQRAEKQKAECLSRLESLSQEERAAKSKPDAWSPLQLMAHLVTVEEWVSNSQEQLAPGAKVLLKGHIFTTFGGGYMRSGLRMPTLPIAEPSGDLDYTTIKTRWNTARIALAPVARCNRPQPRHTHRASSLRWPAQRAASAAAVGCSPLLSLATLGVEAVGFHP